MAPRSKSLVLSGAMLLFPLFSFAQGHPPKLQVVIVAIHDFDDPSYQNALLQTGITDTEQQLNMFFSKHFPDAAVTEIDSPEKTTSGALESFFRQDFPALVNQNVTLLFVLSHGEAQPFPDRPSGSDLYVVSTDTKQAQFKAKGLSLSSDIVGRLSGLLPGTIVYGFIDTCHGEAAHNPNLQILAALDKERGTNLMFMAASLSDQLAFRAGFTSALVTLWNQQSATGCTSPEQAVGPLRTLVKAQSKEKGITLGPNEGYPAVLIPYHGSLCLEDFSAARGFVVVQNSSPDSIVAVFSDSHGAEIHSEPLEGKETVAFGLPKQLYSLTFFQSNQAAETQSVDLTGRSNLAYENFGTPDPAALGNGLETSATMIEQMGAPPEFVGVLQQRAEAAYRIAGDTASAQRVAFASAKLPTFVFHPSGIPTTFGALIVKADASKLAGDVPSAANEYLLAAATAKGTDAGKDAALQAYYAMIADGNTKQAAKIQRYYDLKDTIAPDLKNLPRNPSPQLALVIKDIAVINSLTNNF